MPIAHAYVRRAPCRQTSSTLLLQILETPQEIAYKGDHNNYFAAESLRMGDEKA